MRAGHWPPGLARKRRINESTAADEVHLAARLDDGAEVAVRTFGRRLGSPRDRDRFAEEIAALRGLNDDAHVVAIHDAGVAASGHPYLVTEFCPGGCLRDHLAAVGHLTPAEARAIGAKMAGALAGAHERAIFHRRLKPTNILIDRDGEPRLTDFGLLSLATADGHLRPAVPARPVAYTAPEAFLPELMTGAADVYALGATLYALLAGRAPRAADPLPTAVSGETVVNLPRVPWALMAVLRRAMAFDPRDRFPDLAAMRAALVDST